MKQFFFLLCLFAATYSFAQDTTKTKPKQWLGVLTLEEKYKEEKNQIMCFHFISFRLCMLYTYFSVRSIKNKSKKKKFITFSDVLRSHFLMEKMPSMSQSKITLSVNLTICSKSPSNST